LKKSKKLLTGLALLSTILALGACDEDKKDKDKETSTIESKESVSDESSTSEMGDNSSEDISSEDNSSEEISSESTVESSEEETETDDGLPYEKVRYDLSVDGCELEELKEDKKINIFTISKTTEITNRIREYQDPVTQESFSFVNAITIDNAPKEYVTAVIPKSYKDPETKKFAEGKFVLYVQNGSSGAYTSTIAVTDGNGDVTTYEFDGQNTGSPVCRIEIPVSSEITRASNEEVRTFKFQIGNYKTHIYRMYYESVLKKGEVNGFTVPDVGDTEFLVGQDYDPSKLLLQATYDNGKLKDINYASKEITYDTSNYDKTQSGTYEIKVKYRDYDWYSFNVNVWVPENMTLGFNKTYLGSATSVAKNSQYINGKVKTIYDLGEEYNNKYLSATITGSFNGQTKQFLLKDKELVCTGFDKNKVGEQEITVKYNGAEISQSYKTYTLATSYTVPSETIENNKVYTAWVDDDYTGEVGKIQNIDGTDYACFNNISQALEVLERLGYDKATNAYDKSSEDYKAQKVLKVEPGYYKEKLEINVPNLTIIGSGMCKSTHSEDLAENWDEIAFEEASVIEWNSLYGKADEGGYVQVTDSCQTVAVRESAINCTMYNITLSNYWNCEGIFDKHFGAKYGEHRALALLVQSDKFAMYNSSLLGYQDTVEFFYGRQYLDNCYVSGCTDFIFGTNGTTLFKNSEIHVIYKANAGAYITAMKGMNKNKNEDSVQYGLIFDGCNFTADSTVEKGSAAIGRTWGECAAVMTMNSTIGQHVSITKFNTTDKFLRYISMNALPTADTVKFREYNNSGLGAVSSGLAANDGFTVLSKSEADPYADESVIFGMTNGYVKYNDIWERNKAIHITVIGYILGM